MARRSEHSQEQIKEMVLHAAESIVIEQGIQSLTIRKIAMDIGYTVGSIYMVFANMDDLITHIKLRTLEMLSVRLHQVESESAQEKLELLCECYLDFATEHHNRWQFVFEPSDARTMPIPGNYLDQVKALLPPYEAVLHQLRPTASPAEIQTVAQSIFAGVHGICSLHLSGNFGVTDRTSTTACIRSMIQSFVAGWQAQA